MSIKKYWKEILVSILLYGSIICTYYHFGSFEKLSDAIRAAAFTIGPIIGLTTFFVAMMKFEDYQSDKERDEKEKAALAKLIDFESVVIMTGSKGFESCYRSIEKLGFTSSEIKILISRNIDMLPNFSVKIRNFPKHIDNIISNKKA